jgi:hypothetical protein
LRCRREGSKLLVLRDLIAGFGEHTCHQPKSGPLISHTWYDHRVRREPHRLTPNDPIKTARPRWVNISSLRAGSFDWKPTSPRAVIARLAQRTKISVFLYKFAIKISW